MKQSRHFPIISVVTSISMRLVLFAEAKGPIWDVRVKLSVFLLTKQATACRVQASPTGVDARSAGWKSASHSSAPGRQGKWADATCIDKPNRRAYVQDFTCVCLHVPVDLHTCTMYTHIIHKFCTSSPHYTQYRFKGTPPKTRRSYAQV